MYAGGRRRGSCGGGFDPWFLMLAYDLARQVERLGPDKPVATLAVMALSAGAHFGLLGDARALGLSGAPACLSASRVLERGEWRRLLTSPFAFADEIHLVVNLSSFLHKGHLLERRLGGPRAFATRLCALLLLTQLLYVAVASSELPARILGSGYSISRACVSGLSGANFALAAFSRARFPSGGVSLLGIRVPAEWALWAELVLVFLLNPSPAAVAYHASGALVGVAVERIERGLADAGERLVRLRRRMERKRRAAAGAGSSPSGAAAGGTGTGTGTGTGAHWWSRFVPSSLRRRFARGGTPRVVPGSRVVLAGLRAARANGKRGRARGPDPDAPGRVIVDLDDGGAVSVLPERCAVDLD